MYDHNIKAGNRGDVVKHTALIAVASELMKRCNGTFRYADAYAGYAYNPLKTNGEWRDGIGVLHDSGFSSKIRQWNSGRNFGNARLVCVVRYILVRHSLCSSCAWKGDCHFMPDFGIYLRVSFLNW